MSGKTTTIPAVTRSAKEIELAFAACRAMTFAADDSARHGTWDLNSLTVADKLARQALKKPARKGGLPS